MNNTADIPEARKYTLYAHHSMSFNRIVQEATVSGRPSVWSSNSLTTYDVESFVRVRGGRKLMVQGKVESVLAFLATLVIPRMESSFWTVT